jgi:hypothetical protein
VIIEIYLFYGSKDMYLRRNIKVDEKKNYIRSGADLHAAGKPDRSSGPGFSGHPLLDGSGYSGYRR